MKQIMYFEDHRQRMSMNSGNCWSVTRGENLSQQTLSVVSLFSLNVYHSLAKTASDFKESANDIPSSSVL